MPKVFQLLPALVPGDGISELALMLQREWNRAGVRNEIVATHVAEELAEDALSEKELAKKIREDDVLIVHFSTYVEGWEQLRDLKAKKILNFHNITEPEFLGEFAPLEAARSLEAWKQLKLLLPWVKTVIADSNFNARRVKEQAAQVETRVVPLCYDPARLGTTTAEEEEERAKGYKLKPLNFLYVGRVYPHKRLENVINIFSFYQHFVNPDSRLWLVGNDQTCPDYVRFLYTLLEIKKTKDVIFTGTVSNHQLAKYYKDSQLFITMSAHEGFCLPLLEAMYFGLPILAYVAEATRETLSNSGILIKKVHLEDIAELIYLLMTDELFRVRLVHRQRERLHDFGPERYLGEWKAILTPLGIEFSNSPPASAPES